MAPKTDDPEKMERMRVWLARVEDLLGLEPTVLDSAQEPLLDLISAVAHGPSRPGAPLTAYLVGVAVGRGADPVELATQLGDLAQGHSE